LLSCDEARLHLLATSDLSIDNDEDAPSTTTYTLDYQVLPPGAACGECGAWGSTTSGLLPHPDDGFMFVCAEYEQCQSIRARNVTTVAQAAGRVQDDDDEPPAYPMPLDGAYARCNNCANVFHEAVAGICVKPNVNTNRASGTSPDALHNPPYSMSTKPSSLMTAKH
jgi:hypothetical protein